MSLSELQLPTEEIQIPGGGSFAVRGLAVADISSLFRHHGETLNRVYVDRIEADDFDLAAVARELITTAPLAVAELIALAADEPETWKTVLRLPLPVQIRALEAIAALTFESEADVKNFVEAVIRGSQAVQKVVTALTAPSPDGFGESEGKSPSASPTGTPVPADTL